MSPIANICKSDPRGAAFRGHIWTSRTFSEPAQAVLIAAAGCVVTYVNDIDNAIKSLRPGGVLVVAGFRGIGRGRAEMLANIEKVHSKKSVVMDAATGRLSSDLRQREAMLAEAIVAIANERRGPRKRTAKKDKRMPWDQVAPHYYDPLVSNAQLEAIVANGYAPMSYHTMWRHFKKPRGVPVGRPSVGRAAMRAATL